MSSFVSKKIVDIAKRIKHGEDVVLELGNLNPIREWGNAKDYAYAMWLTLQQKKIKKINIDITWEGTGIDEVGKDQNGIVRIRVSSDYIRPYDPEVLVGNPEKFVSITGFELKNDIDEVIDSMLEE